MPVDGRPRWRAAHSERGAFSAARQYAPARTLTATMAAHVAPMILPSLMSPADHRLKHRNGRTRRSSEKPLHALPNKSADVSVHEPSCSRLLASEMRLAERTAALRASLIFRHAPQLRETKITTRHAFEAALIECSIAAAQECRACGRCGGGESGRLSSRRPLPTPPCSLRYSGFAALTIAIADS